MPAATVSSPSSNSSIIVTRRSDRAFASSLFSNLSKPFGSSLVKPGKPQLGGSIELTPYESVYKDCNVRQRIEEGIRIYDVNPRSAMTRKALTDFNGFSDGEYQAKLAATQANKDRLSLDPTPSHSGHDIRSQDFARIHSSRRKHRQIYYFAGGGWQSPSAKEHWKLAAHLAKEGTEELRTTTVSIVSYPLAPNTTAAKSLAMLTRLYHVLLRPLHAIDTDDEDEFKWRPPPVHDNEEIIFAGDSSGGNIALALTLHILSTDPRAPAPHGLLLISPAVDLRNCNPEMQAIAKKDPILTMSLVNNNAKAWCGADIQPEDPRVSPLLGNLSVLAQRNVVVNGVIGTYDVLAPDAILLRKKLAECGVRGRWLEWEKQIHCFPLAFSYGQAEGKEAVKWILETLAAPPIEDRKESTV